MKVCIIGLGYIGLPTAAMFASSGVNVLGVDSNEKVIEALNCGKILIEEEGLCDLVKQGVDQGFLKGGTDPEEADVFIIAVPTPIGHDKKANMSHVISATEKIVPYIKKGDTVILESTSPVGTVNDLMVPILEKSGLKAGSDIYLGHSPERVIPGQILKELINNSRIAGGIDPQSSERIREVYRTFVKGEIFLSDARTAELCKTAENTYRDINIAFANELAIICETIGVNVWEAIELCNKHPRVNIHQPGPGVGGHCIAVDPWFIVEKQPGKAKLINQSRNINDFMPHHVASEIINILNGIADPVITILGITYKPNVDDVRESPILKLVDILKKRGLTVKAYDPHALSNPVLTNSLEGAVKGSDLLILGVHHDEFNNLSFGRLGPLMRHRNIYDTRNFIDAESARANGFKCYLLGSPAGL